MSARRPGWVPNQHGAWAMIVTPLLVGVLATRPRPLHLLLAAFWFAGYFAFFATGLWLKSRRRPRYLPPVLTYTALAAVLGIALLVAAPRLLAWVPYFAVPLGVGLAASAVRDERSLWSGVATTAGSCLMTLVAADVGGEDGTRRIWTLTAVLAAYFVGTVLYVKTLIRERGDPRYLAASVLFHAIAAVGAFLVAVPLGIVFALLTLRAAVVPRWAPTPKQAGIGEIVATLAVALTALATL